MSETVCIACWRIIPDGEDIYFDDGEPYCSDCYERIIGGME